MRVALRSKRQNPSPSSSPLHQGERCLMITSKQRRLWLVAILLLNLFQENRQDSAVGFPIPSPSRNSLTLREETRFTLKLAFTSVRTNTPAAKPAARFLISRVMAHMADLICGDSQKFVAIGFLRNFSSIVPWCSC